jgi:hypothetical protein
MEHLLAVVEHTSLFKSIPDTGSMTSEPKTEFTLEVKETAMPFRSTIELWLYVEVSPTHVQQR